MRSLKSLLEAGRRKKRRKLMRDAELLLRTSIRLPTFNLEATVERSLEDTGIKRMPGETALAFLARNLGINAAQLSRVAQLVRDQGLRITEAIAQVTATPETTPIEPAVTDFLPIAAALVLTDS